MPLSRADEAYKIMRDIEARRPQWVDPYESLLQRKREDNMTPEQLAETLCPDNEPFNH